MVQKQTENKKRHKGIMAHSVTQFQFQTKFSRFDTKHTASNLNKANVVEAHF